MSWHFSDDFEHYLEVVAELLERSPVENTVALTQISVARANRSHPAASGFFGWCTNGREVIGAVSSAPGHDLLLTVIADEDVIGLVNALRARSVQISGVSGAARAVDAFAAAWTHEGQVQATTSMRQLLYRLDTLWAVSAPGRARPAVQADWPLVSSWFAQFSREAGLRNVNSDAWAWDQLADHRLWLWCQADQAVSMAGRHRTSAGVARVGPVYTPESYRRRGYGAAVTAVCAQAALETDADQVVLYADLANPTSNAVYRRIGFVPVREETMVSFHVRPVHD